VRTPRKAEAGLKVRLGTTSRAGRELAEHVKSILETKKLTLHTVSHASESIFGHASAYVLPHNLYYELRVGTFSPSLQQLFALSKISNYKMTDWIRIFGFDLEQIPRLQILLPTKRTIIVDSSLSEPNTWVPWLQDRPNVNLIPPLAPLSQFLTVGPSVRQSSLLAMNKEHFLYAKIGREDAFAFPDLLPGSIVRIDSRLGNDFLEGNRISSDRLFLVEHEKGLFCCRLLLRGKNRIVPVSTHLAYVQVGLQLDHEAKIIGTADLEIRTLTHVPQPDVPKELAHRWVPKPLLRGSRSLSQFLQAARTKMALSLRDASAVSLRIASMLQDERYFISASSLSDYEASDTVPRHFQKVISLCLIYALPFRTLLQVVGIPDRYAGKESMPDGLIPRLQPPHIATDAVEDHEGSNEGFLDELVHRCEDVPVFLKHTVAEISGLPSPSLQNFFWLGGVRTALHPYLENALLVSVDRHRKRPSDSRSRPVWKQSLYLVLKRDGTYLCGPCGVENGAIVMHPDAEHLHVREEFRNHRDAEVVGQVCAVVRKL
jgi:hypothetical protein